MRRRRRGFTLLEVIIAVAMGAVLAASLYAALAIAFDAREQVRRQTLAPAEASMALATIAQDFVSLPVPGDGLAGPFIGVQGGDDISPADGLELYNVSRDRITGFAGFHRVSLALVNGDLVRGVTTNLLGTNSAEPDVQEILLTGVRGFALRYHDGASWVPAWDSTISASLPYAVEISIVLTADAPGGGDVYTASRIVPIATGGVGPQFNSAETGRIP